MPPAGIIWGRLTFGPSSTITVKVPGQARSVPPPSRDRSIKDTYINAKDPLGAPSARRVYMNAGGTVSPGALPADPLCTAAPIAPLTVDRATTLHFPGAHTPPRPLELTLVLRAGPRRSTGCARKGRRRPRPRSSSGAIPTRGAGGAAADRRRRRGAPGGRRRTAVVLDTEPTGPGADHPGRF